MNRRQFLGQSSAVAGAVAVAAIAKDSYAKRSPNETINVAIAGINSRGGAHYEGFSSIPNVRISHVVDPDARLFASKLPGLRERFGGNPKTETDVRRVLDDPDVDVLAIATPDHWHALMAIWACQAGKDVYCEKPVSHNISEGRKIVEAARRYDRVVATGTQSRSDLVNQEAVKFLHDGGLGKLYAAKAICFKPRDSIGVKPMGPAPNGLDWDLWQGPASVRPYSENIVHYKWHWNWDYGTTDMGNQGVHQMDVMRWGMNKREHPRTIHGVGGLYENGARTDQQTPNTQYTTFEYGDGSILHFEVRGWHTGSEAGLTIGNFFYGQKGWMYINGSEFRTFMGRNGEPGPSLTWMESDYDIPPDTPFASSGFVRPDSTQRHFDNFIACVRSRRWQELRSDILEGHMSAALAHLGNMSYRLGRPIHFDSHSERCNGDAEANALLTRRYREPFVVPETV